MAEGTPSRFVGDDGEVEVESEEDETPREWPAYKRAYAALRRAQQGRDTGKQLANPRKLLWHNIAGYVQDGDAKTPADTHGQAGVGTI